MGKGRRNLPGRKQKPNGPSGHRAVKLLEQKLDSVINSVNQHLGLLFKNEREIGSMVYTNSVRVAVIRRIIREKLGIDDVAFEALCDQEVARRKAEEEEAQKKAQEEAKRKAVEAAAKESAEQAEPEVETKEFGGDFGEEQEPDGGEAPVGAEDGDQDTSDGGGPEEPEGAVDGSGPDPGDVQPVADGGEEGQPSDSV